MSLKFDEGPRAILKVTDGYHESGLSVSDVYEEAIISSICLKKQKN